MVEYLRAGELDGLPLVTGGRSSGARVACRTADACGAVGVLCLAFPLQPPRREGAAPAPSRLGELEGTAVPVLIVQGERDPFGTRAEVETFLLSSAIRLHWAGDGDHDLGPRGASGFTRKGNLTSAADAIAEFASRLG